MGADLSFLHELFNTLAIVRISTLKVRKLTLNNLLSDLGQITSNVLAQVVLVLLVHEAIQVARLSKIVVSNVVAEATDQPLDFLGSKGRAHNVVLHRTTDGIGAIVGSTAIVAIDHHGTVTLVGVYLASRSVDGDLLVVDAQSMTMRIRIRKETALQQAIS